MRLTTLCAGLIAAGLITISGCSSSSSPPSESTTMPATAPAIATPATQPAAAAAAPEMKITPTHMLSKDEPYYKSVPTAGATPDGTLKSGTKVLLFSFAGDYSKVSGEDGTTMYVLTDGLDPISKK